jgi:hypothetical protein
MKAECAIHRGIQVAVHCIDAQAVGIVAAVQYTRPIDAKRDLSMLSMIVVAVPLLAIAAACWFIAGRIDLKRKIKGWSGERTTLDEVNSARTRILLLRVAAGVCAVAAIAGASAVSLIAAYAAR